MVAKLNEHSSIVLLFQVCQKYVYVEELGFVLPSLLLVFYFHDYKPLISGFRAGYINLEGIQEPCI